MTPEFDELHAPGSGWVTASSWPCLVLPPEERPSWLPSPFAYGAHLLGTAPLNGDAPETRRGKLLEPVAYRLLEESGVEIVERQRAYRHREIRAAATPDGTALRSGERVGIEIKVVNHRDYEAEWPATYHRVQANAQMACSGYAMTMLVPLVVGWKSLELGELYEQPRHPGMIEVLEEKAREFLARLALGELPDPDETASSYAAWQKVAALAKGETERLLEPDAVIRAQMWRQARLDAKAAAAVEEAQRCWFASNAGEAETLELLDGTLVTRKRRKRKGFEVEATSFIEWKLKEST